MNHSSTSLRGFALALVSAVLTANLAVAQIPYYYSPTKGMAPGPRQEANSNSSGSSSTRSRSGGIGLMAGEIMPFIWQNNVLSSLPDVRNTGWLDNSAQIWLHVPATAQVWFNGNRTMQTGDLRHYVTPPLTPGKEYSYKVRVRWMENGKPVETVRTIRVHASEGVRSDFNSAGKDIRSSAQLP